MYRKHRASRNFWKRDEGLARDRYLKLLVSINTIISIADDREKVVQSLSTETVSHLWYIHSFPPPQSWRARLVQADNEAERIVRAGLVPGVPAGSILFRAPSSSFSSTHLFG